MRRFAFVIATVFVFAALNVAVWQKELLIRDGRRVLLELAPVDPRSLMQGDYMQLEFKLFDESARQPDLDSEDFPVAGCLIARVDENRVARYDRLCDETEPAPDEVRLRFRKRRPWRTVLRVTSDSFFFEEGRAREFQLAKYAEIAVAPDGGTALLDLFDEGFLPIRPRRQAAP